MGTQTLTVYFTSRFLLSSWVRCRREAFSSYKAQIKTLLHFHSNMIQMCSQYLIQSSPWRLFIICNTESTGEKHLEIHAMQSSQKQSDRGKLCKMKRDRQTAANCTDLCPGLCSQHPNNPCKHHPFTHGELKHNIVPVLTGSTKRLSCVFLARSIQKSSAQVCTASCGTLKVITHCSKAPCFLSNLQKKH